MVDCCMTTACHPLQVLVRRLWLVPLAMSMSMMSTLRD